MPLEEMGAFFARRLEGYDAHMLRDIAGAEEFYPAAAALLPTFPGCRILDLGCGTGLELGFYFPGNPAARVTGIDLSPKTIERARENLKEYPNITLVCGDFTAYAFQETFDAVYASLTMMHFADKRGVIEKAAALLNPGGLLCLSLDKNRSEWIDMGTRRVKIYPDDPAETARLMTAAGLRVTVTSETPFAHIVAGEKRK